LHENVRHMDAYAMFLASVALLQRHRVADFAAGTQQDQIATSLLLLRSSKTGSGSLDVLPLLRQRQQ
jgi:hypothetical protein